MSHPNRQAATRSRVAGYTMIELVFTFTILSAVLFGIGFASQKASDAYEQNRVRTAIVSRGYQALDRIADEFVEAEAATITPAAPGVGATTITYRISDGAGGFGPDRTIRFEMEPGELDDGIDNDQDGTIDEARVFWIEDEGGANERSVVLVNGVRSLMANEVANFIDEDGNGLVDERGLVFQLDGSVLNVQLTLEELDLTGRAISKTFQTAVRIRN